MQKIIIVGDTNNIFSKALYLVLKEKAGVVLVSSNTILDCSINEIDYLIISVETISEIQTDGAIIIFKKEVKINSTDDILSKNNYAIYFENTQDFNYNNNLVIGHNDSCDIIISSCNEDNIYISLNHTIYTLKNKELMPCEIKITIKELTTVDIYAVITSVIILLLTEDKQNKKLEYNL